MRRIRFNQEKQKSANSLSKIKAHKLLLEDNDNIDMKDTYKITNVHLLEMKKFCQ